MRTSRIICFFLADEAQAPLFHSGEELLADQIMLYAPDTEHYQRSTAACHWGAVSLAPDDLAAAGIAIAGRELAPPTVTQHPRAGLIGRAATGLAHCCGESRRDRPGYSCTSPSCPSYRAGPDPHHHPMLDRR
jgi:hypothetical protein